MIDDLLKTLLLETVEFRLNGKTFKRGKIILYSVKHFNICFSLQTDQGLRKVDFPYPFTYTRSTTGIDFSYQITDLKFNHPLSIYKLKTCTKQPSKLYNQTLQILIHEPS